MSFDKTDGELGKTITVMVTMKSRPQKESEPYIPIGGSLRRPMRKTNVHHVTGDQLGQIAIDEIRRPEKNREHTHDSLHLGIGHQRKVNEGLNRPHTQVQPDFVVLDLHVLSSWLDWHDHVEHLQALKTGLNRLKECEFHHVQLHFQTVSRCPIDLRFASRKKL